MKSNKSNLIIVFLAVLVICLSGYIIYERTLKDDIGDINNNNNENNNATIDNNSIDENSFDLEAAQQLISKYYLGNDGLLQGFINLNEEDQKIYVTLRQTNRENVTCEEAYKNNNNVSIDGEQYLIKAGEQTFTCYRNTTMIQYDEINNIYKSLFGTDQNIPKKDITNGLMSNFYYDEEKNIFIEVEYNGGGMNYNFNFYTVKSAQISSNELIIKVGYAVADFNHDNSTYQIELQNKKITYKQEEAQRDDFQEDFIAEYEDNMNVYTFTFVKDNDSYVLKNIEK